MESDWRLRRKIRGSEKYTTRSGEVETNGKS